MGVYNSPTLQWPGVKTPGFEATTWGARGKRSAEPEPYYGYYGLYHPYGYYGLGRGVAGRAGGGVSYTHRSPQGIGKRSAEPEPHYGYYGQYAWPSATGYGFTSTCFGCRGKRSAEPSRYEYANPGVGSFTKVSAPYLFPHFVGPLTKRSAEAD